MFTLRLPVVLFKLEQASSYSFHKDAARRTAPVLLSGVELETRLSGHPKSTII